MKKLSEKERLLNHLAETIAKDFFEYLNEFYEDSSEDFANDGITKATYIASGSELISEDVAATVEDLEEKVHEVFERLVMKSFPRVKKSDFIR